MANPLNGEAEITIGQPPNDRVYKLKLSFDALVNIEELTGQSIDQVFESIKDKPRLKTMRQVFFCALHENHPEITERLAGELLLQASLPAILAAITRAGEAAFNVKEEVGGDGSESPP